MVRHAAVRFSVDAIVPEIIRLGMLRSPHEACGIVIPDLNRTADDWVHELVNRSPDPLNSYEIDVSSIKALQTDPRTWSDCLVWHTHPKGNVGPSRGDLRVRVPGLSYLVVALPRGEAVIF